LRTLQGLSAGTGMVVSRTKVRDLYEGPAAQRLIANIAVMFAVAPAIAPIIGGWILHLAGWRAIFVFLTLASALLCAVCVWKLPESLPPEKRQLFTVLPLLQGYKDVFSNWGFIALSVSIGATFGGYFLYILSAPVFIREHRHLGATEFYWLFVPGMVGMMAGSWFSGRIAGHWDDRRILRLSFIIMAISALVNLATSEFVPDSRLLAVLPLSVYSLGVAFAMPNMPLVLLDMYPQNRGMAASCRSFIQTLFGAVIAATLAPWRLTREVSSMNHGFQDQTFSVSPAWPGDFPGRLQECRQSGNDFCIPAIAPGNFPFGFKGKVKPKKQVIV
jgi:DHA1 family bicyclomycin/chloramphenicol resistance-like MFS transporter